MFVGKIECAQIIEAKLRQSSMCAVEILFLVVLFCLLSVLGRGLLIRVRSRQSNAKPLAPPLLAAMLCWLIHVSLR